MIEDLFDLFSQRDQKQYIVIDGLDECDTAARKLVLSFFNSRVERLDMKDPGKMRVLFVSQRENDIKEALLAAAVITLQPTDNASDIRFFVRKSTMEIQSRYDLEDRQVDYVIDSTCERAKGIVSSIRIYKYLTQVYRYVFVCEAGHVQPVRATHTPALSRRDQTKQIPAGTWTSVSHVETIFHILASPCL